MDDRWMLAVRQARFRNPLMAPVAIAVRMRQSLTVHQRILADPDLLIALTVAAIVLGRFLARTGFTDAQ
jgi:hypothetical protein